MLAPNLTQADFLHALQAYMPRGRVWPREASSVLASTLSGFAAFYVSQTANANGLLVDAFPSTTNGLLTEWQETLAQPDPAGPMPSGLAQAQQFVVAKLTLPGGQSIASFQAFAAAYGITITVQEFAPFRAGQSHAGSSCGGPDWFNSFIITMPTAQSAYAGLLREVAPAHTALNFIFT